MDPISPGEILKEEFLKPLKISVNKLALVTNIDPRSLKRILSGEARLLPIHALKLSKYFENTPEFWLNLQHKYNHQIDLLELKKLQ